MPNLSRRDFAMRAALPAAAGIGALSVSPAFGMEPDKKNVDDAASFTQRFATVNGIRMHYVSEGVRLLAVENSMRVAIVRRVVQR